MELKPGYKQTEAGVIPEDWGIDVIKNAYEIRNDLRLPLSENVRKKMQGPYPYYGPTKVQDYINEYRVEGEYCLIGEDGDHFLKWKDMPMTLLVRGKFNVNNHAHLVCGIRNETIWFHYYFKNRDITRHLTRQGAGRYKLTKGTLENIPLAIPPTKTEQTAIANALSDADALIQSLIRLIAKKRQIKQGTMQTLLNPYENERLKAGWAVKELGELIAHCSSGATPYRGIPSFYKGNIKWITSGELNYNIIEDTIEKISLHAVEKTNLKIHPIGTFLMAITGLEAEGTRGACGIVGSPAATNQSCMAIYPKKELITDYLYHYYVYKGKELALEYCQGTKQQSYTAKLVKILPIALPRTTDEQIDIATILSDMDTEIAALEAKLAKYQHIKQGMMQNLLTGHIRLVKPENNTGAVA